MVKDLLDGFFIQTVRTRSIVFQVLDVERRSDGFEVSGDLTVNIKEHVRWDLRVRQGISDGRADGSERDGLDGQVAWFEVGRTRHLQKRAVVLVLRIV